MRLEWLEDVVAVSETGSFSEAAERRHLTRSAFSRRIETIEEYVGVDLFDRTRKLVQLLDHVLDQREQIVRLAGMLRELVADQRQEAPDPGCVPKARLTGRGIDANRNAPDPGIAGRAAPSLPLCAVRDRGVGSQGRVDLVIEELEEVAGGNRQRCLRRRDNVYVERDRCLQRAHDDAVWCIMSGRERIDDRDAGAFADHRASGNGLMHRYPQVRLQLGIERGTGWMVREERPLQSDDIFSREVGR